VVIASCPVTRNARHLAAPLGARLDAVLRNNQINDVPFDGPARTYGIITR